MATQYQAVEIESPFIQIGVEMGENGLNAADGMRTLIHIVTSHSSHMSHLNLFTEQHPRHSELDYTNRIYSEDED